jgi:hypothetical protein
MPKPSTLQGKYSAAGVLGEGTGSKGSGSVLG